MRARIWGGFALLTVIWGASFLWIKIAVLDVGVFPLAAYRLVFAVGVLAPFVVWQRSGPPRDAATWRALAIVGLAGSTCPWLLIAYAEITIDSALATVLNSTAPLFTILIAHFALHDDRMTPARVIGLLVGFAGVVVLCLRDAPSLLSGDRQVALGYLAMLGAALCYAVSSVSARRWLRHMRTLPQVFYSLLISCIVSWALLMIVVGAAPVPAGAAAWAGIVWLGVLGAGVGAFVYFFLLHTVGPTRSSLITYLIPPVGVTLGIIVLGERLDLFLVAGSLLIVTALWVVNRL